VRVLPDVAKPTLAAALSPDGKWLSYAAPSEERIYAYQFDTGRYFFVRSMLGAPAVWHPNSRQFLVNDLDVVVYHGDEESAHIDHNHQYDNAIHLFTADIQDESRQALTFEGNVDDASPVWSPDGEWIVFGRKPIRTNTGRQLWLMQADGTQLQTLTDDLTIHHGLPSWSPDGRFLLFQRVNVLDSRTPPGIYTLNIETGQFTLITSTGRQPSWLN
jgi:TolB protein